MLKIFRPDMDFIFCFLLPFCLFVFFYLLFATFSAGQISFSNFEAMFLCDVKDLRLDMDYILLSPTLAAQKALIREF